MCCVPYILVYLSCFFCLLADLVLIAVYALNKHQISHSLQTRSYDDSDEYDDSGEIEDDDDDDVAVGGNVSVAPAPLPAPPISLHASTADEFLLSMIICLSLLLALLLVANMYTIGNCIKALLSSQRNTLQKAVAVHDVKVKSEGYLQV